MIGQVQEAIPSQSIQPGGSAEEVQNFSGLFEVPTFPLYLGNSEGLSHQTSQSSWFFLH